MARSLSRDKKTSHFLKDLSSYMSSSRHKAFSKHIATRPDLPVWGSLKLASYMTGAPKLSLKEGLHTEGFRGYSPSASFEVPEEALFFCWTLVVQVSLNGGC